WRNQRERVVEVCDVRLFQPDELTHRAVAVTGPKGAGGDASPPEQSRFGYLVVLAYVLDDFVACARQQLSFGGENDVFAARMLITVVDEQYLHGSGAAVRESARTNRTASSIRPAANAGVTC